MNECFWNWINKAINLKFDEKNNGFRTSLNKLILKLNKKK